MSKEFAIPADAKLGALQSRDRARYVLHGIGHIFGIGGSPPIIST